MALTPFGLGHKWWDVAPARLGDQNFGMGVMAEVQRDIRRLNNLMETMAPRTTYWPQIHQSGGVSEVTNDKEKFQVHLDVSHFHPEEITVKTTEGMLVIEGKHDEKLDQHGYVSRHFTRKYVVPKDVDAKAMVSSLSPEGILTVGAPKMALTAPTETKIPIQMGTKTDAIEGKK